ncbi:MAG: undecaprenyl-diphosphate phosphatase [Synergistaceae bacterium]|jgi:undecaprenyl-diphosphatase|nr:undecaprenyl-diphosphate phosphatase [Synergistaceae bacterium]
MKEETLFLGLLQGVTEFLPVSSSGHLGIAKIAIGIADPSFAFDLVLHLATLLAVFVFFARDIASLLMEWLFGFFNRNARAWAGWRFGWAVIAGVVVTAPIGILLEPFAARASANLLWLGGNLWITAILLLSSKSLGRDRAVRAKDGLFVGLVQGIAVIPGISRSGSTMWAGLLLGFSRSEAFRFSFLLSVPTIAGAALYEAAKMGGGANFMQALPDGWMPAAALAFASGLASLFLLKKAVVGDRCWVFSIYNMIAGGTACILYFMGV